MDLLFVKRHNVCAFLDANDPKSSEFVSVLNFLSNSNISFAISHNLPVFEVSIREFWETVELVTINNVEHIRATVREQEVLFSEAKIKQVLIYFVHIFIHCLSVRKGGFDSANGMVASAVLGLIKGRNYNFSGLVFTQLKENLIGDVKEKFLVYPRFLQIIIYHLHTNLQQGGNILVFDYIRAKTLSYMKSKYKRTNIVIADIPLFRHVIGEEEEFLLDIDPDLPIEEDDELSEEEELEVEKDEGN
ncbi:hypothetical protein L1987_52829 [Smallanthus sonchifolius]|uniref:Uncharacterized protein n=1 Tax=Smallanthus sonchifolius TaxID=185202 RepID=A0ACB9ETP6_9ASTR|nr:hypothetical protein L1987_52829 [Smallanthus sonchifolius]